MAAKQQQAAEVNEYLRKHQLAPLQIEVEVDSDLGCVVVIPCRDEPDVMDTLESLSACQPPGCSVEVLLVVNSAADSSSEEREQNRLSAAQARAFAQSRCCPSGLRIEVLEFLDLAPREAGVGLARRLGMDEAVARLHSVNREQAPIVCLDADCRVAGNYLQAVVGHFREQPRSMACSVYFEHPLSGDAQPQVYRAIAEYELYLRYFRLALERAGYPYAHHTLGSCMAVRSRAYQACGGMNKRQGAEDFHFLSKLMLQGDFSDLTTTTVSPAPRPSHRVPFGTGRAVAKRLRETSLLVYPLEVFEAIAELVRGVGCWARQDMVTLTGPSAEYFRELGLQARLAEVRQQTASPKAFTKRLYRWLNPLCMVKFANHLSAGPYPRIPVIEAAGRLLEGTPAGALETNAGTQQVVRLLERYRELDRAVNEAR